MSGMTNRQTHDAWKAFARQFLEMILEKRAKLYANDSSTTGGLLEIALCEEDDGCKELWKAIEKLEHESSRQFAEQFISSSVEERLLCSPHAVGRAFYHIVGCLGSAECEKMRERLLSQENLDPQIQALIAHWNNAAESYEPLAVAREFKHQKETPLWAQRN